METFPWSMVSRFKKKKQVEQILIVNLIYLNVAKVSPFRHIILHSGFLLLHL